MKIVPQYFSIKNLLYALLHYMLYSLSLTNPPPFHHLKCIHSIYWCLALSIHVIENYYSTKISLFAIFCCSYNKCWWFFFSIFTPESFSEFEFFKCFKIFRGPIPGKLSLFGIKILAIPVSGNLRIFKFFDFCKFSSHYMQFQLQNEAMWICIWFQPNIKFFFCFLMSIAVVMICASVLI